MLRNGTCSCECMNESDGVLVPNTDSADSASCIRQNCLDASMCSQGFAICLLRYLANASTQDDEEDADAIPGTP